MGQRDRITGAWRPQRGQAEPRWWRPQHRQAVPGWWRLTAGMLVSLAACSQLRGPVGPGTETAGMQSEQAECPAEIRDQVKLTASAAPSSSTAGATLTRQGETNMLVGRTVMISISPGSTVVGLRVRASTLSLATIGGTLQGSAERGSGAADPARRSARVREISTTRAIDVIPGRLRITPFITGTRLRPQTLSVDLRVIPGGAAVDEMTIQTEALWDAQRHPVSPQVVSLSLTPVRHFAVYDQVLATASLTFDVRRSPSDREYRTCSLESRFPLVDRAAIEPDLWDLRKAASVGGSELWLAVFSPQAGPFRAIFATPGQATALARWLHETHASHLGTYELGMFRPGYSRDSLRTLPLPHSVADTFRAATAEDLDNLSVGRLGEP